MLSIFAINFDANMLQIKRNIFAYSSKLIQEFELSIKVGNTTIND